MNVRLRKCVYVAGAISSDNVIEVFNNIRIGINESVDVMKSGYSPFSPFIDFQFALHRFISIEEFYEYSLSQLVKQDALYVIPSSVDADGVIKSKGTLAEIELAKELGIPVFYSLDELIRGMPPC
jgi:hypothetical protein